MCLIIWESFWPGIIFRHWVHHVWRVMVKVSHDFPVQAQKGGKGMAPTHLQPSTRRWVISTHSGRLTPGKKTATHFYRRLRGRCGWHRKSRPHQNSVPGSSAHSKSLIKLHCLSCHMWRMCLCTCDLTLSYLLHMFTHLLNVTLETWQ